MSLFENLKGLGKALLKKAATKIAESIPREAEQIEVVEEVFEPLYGENIKVFKDGYKPIFEEEPMPPREVKEIVMLEGVYSITGERIVKEPEPWEEGLPPPI